MYGEGEEMADIEKVLKGLEHCSSSLGCFECPYSELDERTIECHLQIDMDALELLKEQKQKIDVLEDQNAKLIRQKQERFQQKWIPVEKEHPNEGRFVLVATPAYTDDDGEEYVEGVQCAYWLFRSWFSSDGVTYGNGGMLKVNPTHWMPLPEKP